MTKPTIDETHNPDATSWVEGANDHRDFPVQNLPLGIFTPSGSDKKRGGMAIGDYILDLPAIAELLDGDAAEAARLTEADSLNALFEKGNDAADALRARIFALLTDAAHADDVRPALHKATDCSLHLPFAIGDYTDFYTGINHALNVGRQFRPDNPLLPNYKYVPIGYHGRSSSVLASGGDVRRPTGQQRNPDGDTPLFGPSKRLDYEMEMAVWVGAGNNLGEPISIEDAPKHIAGVSILNDWSARDIQAWEYQPLGPFLAKSFHSTVSPWLVTSAALAPFRMAQAARPEGDPDPLPYLLDSEDQAHGALSVMMEVNIRTEKMREAGAPPVQLSRGPMSTMYWTMAQLITHHSVNGCDLRPGDLLGTGTLSGEEADSFGSLLELSDGGKKPIDLGNGETRSFLENGDEIIMTAHGEREGYRAIGFGECRARIVA